MNTSDVRVYGVNSTGAKRNGKAKEEVIDESVVYNHYAILSVRRKNSLVSKSKETTRTHPEHGRKDLLQ